MSNYIIVKCDYCGENTEKTAKEYNRSIKKGMNLFCNLSCSAIFNNNKNKGKPPSQGIIAHLSNMRNLKKNVKKPNPYKYFIYRCGRRNKDFDIDEEYLKELWNKDSKCPYTGFDLILPIGVTGFEKDVPLIRKASLDRIDCSKGYIKGNVQFVSFIANMAKNTLSHTEMIELCRSIAKKWKEE